MELKNEAAMKSRKARVAEIGRERCKERGDYWLVVVVATVVRAAVMEVNGW